MLEIITAAQVLALPIGGATLEASNTAYHNVEPYVLIPRNPSIKKVHGTLFQGAEDIHGENSVSHYKKDGFINVMSRNTFRFEHSAGVTIPHAFFHGVNIGSIPCKFKGSTNAQFSGKYGYTLALRHWNDGYTFITSFIWDYKDNVQVIRFESKFSADYRTSISKPSVSYTVFLPESRHYKEGDPIRSLGDVLHDETVSAKKAGTAPLPSTEGRHTYLKFLENKVTGADEYNTLNLVTHRFKLPVVPNMYQTYGKLAQEAVQKMNQLNMNGLQYINEAIHIKQLLPPVSDLMKLDSSLKSWANVYLWIRYGLKLSYADTKALIKTLPSIFGPKKQYKDKLRRLRARSTQTVVSCGRDWKVDLSFKALIHEWPKTLRGYHNTLDTLYDLDLMPTLENIHDMIPYSFVLDWIIPISNALENLDTRTRQQSFDLAICTLGVKYTSPIDLKSTSTTHSVGEATDVFYGRTLTPHFPTYGLIDSLGDRGEFKTQRVIDAASLIIQRS